MILAPFVVVTTQHSPILAITTFSPDSCTCLLTFQKVSDHQDEDTWFEYQIFITGVPIRHGEVLLSGCRDSQTKAWKGKRFPVLLSIFIIS
ncbi:hypothetical protein PAHAL_5G255300 [Panicum hallii]|uniref:Uncharacterized protein n=1 Tax=Panicum hallii TaxID=206008 RepID=A0A2T8IL91_9POAL|nr:hypothetical protein PAHAL_5G255300 [Panicum hallii]